MHKNEQNAEIMYNLKIFKTIIAIQIQNEKMSNILFSSLINECL